MDRNDDLTDLDRLDAEGRAHTKVVATIGPASEARLGELIDAGLSVARINFSHDSPEAHTRRIAAVRAAARERGVEVGILADIRGPKLRLGLFEGGTRTLELDDRVFLREGGGIAGPDEVLVDVPGFEASLRQGHRVYLADGAIELLAEEWTDDGWRAVVTRGGVAGDKKGVHLPDADLDLQVPTEQDIEDLKLARELEVDLIGVSFVARAEEVRRVRSLVPEALVVAKIERAAAIENLPALLEAADGIMVARGDLGVEVELEQLPMLQKSLIQSALMAGKFTITATEMLESMVHCSRPTRAEVTDVANAVLDGTDAIMLSAETAVGDYPVAAVRTMDRIAKAVEASDRYAELSKVVFRASEPTFSNAVALAAAKSAEALSLGKIVCFTETGNTVRLISRYRPRAEIIALSPHERTLARMTVLAHVRPMTFERHPSLEDMLEGACALLQEKRVVQSGEEIVFVAGVPPGVARSTNVMKLHRIGDPLKLH